MNGLSLAPYQLYFKTVTKQFNIFDVQRPILNHIVDCYKYGKVEFSVSGTKYTIGRLKEFQIFQGPINPWTLKLLNANVITPAILHSWGL